MSSFFEGVEDMRAFIAEARLEEPEERLDGAGEGEGEGEEGNQRRERHGLSASLLRSWWLAARSRLIRTTTEDDDITPLGSEIRLTVENPYRSESESDADDRSRSGEE